MSHALDDGRSSLMASPVGRRQPDLRPHRRDDRPVAAEPAGSYWSRLGFYLVCTVAASMYGATFTWSSSWRDADPWTAGPHTALLWLGPAFVVAAAAPLRRAGTAVIGACFASAMVLMWSQFAAEDSSTSAIVFMLGWVVGIPASCVLVAVTVRQSRRR